MDSLVDMELNNIINNEKTFCIKIYHSKFFIASKLNTDDKYALCYIQSY